MSVTNFSTGGATRSAVAISSSSPNESIAHTDAFDDQNLPGEMRTTIALKSVSVGTEVRIAQEGIPAAIPAEACYLGRQESRLLLARLVEAAIPD